MEPSTKPLLYLRLRWLFTLGLAATALASPLSSSLHAISTSSFNLPAQDSAGWTILPSPAADSRLIYVDSNNGNDALGQYSLPGDVGSDPQSPNGTIKPFKTLNAAYAEARNDKPDWILLRSGRVWANQSLKLRRGKSPSARAVVTSYRNGKRPEIRSGSARAILETGPANIIVKGIKFWAHTRDSDSPHFTGYDGQTGFNFFTRSAGDRRNPRNALFEDCVFRSYKGNVITGNRGSGNAPVDRIAFRRCLFSGNYSTTGHSQGMFHSASGHPVTVPPSILLEENTFDRNGWRIRSRGNGRAKEDGQATIFNHNIYYSSARKVLITGNLFLRASSMGIKLRSDTTGSSSDITMVDNLFAEGEIGIGAGGNTEEDLRFDRLIIDDNVFTDIGRSRPTNRNLAWALDVEDWGQRLGYVRNNLFLNQNNASLTNVFAMRFRARGRMENVRILDNLVYNVEGGSGSRNALVQFENGDNASNVRFRNNIIDASGRTPVASIGMVGGYDFWWENIYHSGSPRDEWFVVGGRFSDFDKWVSETGDGQALEGAATFPDPDRDLERYIDELGLGRTFNHFVREVKRQSESRWIPDLTAPVINDWFRDGFDFGQ